VPPLALRARKGCWPLASPGLGSEHGSPTLSLSDLSSYGRWPDSEPGSPSLLSDASLDDWGLEAGEELGFGSMGIVQKVRRHHDCQDLAAKRVFSSEPEQLKVLEDEYKLLQSLNHNNIIQVKAFFCNRAGACLCMELCGGGSIAYHVEVHGAFSEVRMKMLSVQLFEGVDYLHCKRAVHRDIKPANLLLLPGAAQLKIGDFGCARWLGRGAAGGAMLSERGTQLYSAPELRFGLQWNERVDVWASGLCAFVMLRAELPFDGGSRAAMRLLRKGRLPQISWGGAAGSGTRSWVLQCLTVEMRDRPTAMELLWHPDLAEHRAGAAGAVTPERGRAHACATPGGLPSCGLLAAPARPGSADAVAPQSDFEQALRQLARNRFLRTVVGQLSERPTIHRSPF